MSPAVPAKKAMNTPAVHIYEPTGYAGIFQHASQLAHIMGEQPDLRVVLHTAVQHEHVGNDGFEMCTCSWWPRRNQAGGAVAKRVGIAGRLLARTLPHLLHTTRRGDILHLQGPGPANGFNLIFLWAARIRGCRVVYSPHDTFSRRGRLDDRLLQLTYRPADAVVVYSQADRERLQHLSSCIYVAPLSQPVPAFMDEQVLRWRREWRAQDPDIDVVLCAGFVRPDKRLDLLIDSARSWPAGRRLAVVGEDRGDWTRCAQLAAEAGVEIASRIDFIELDVFAAAIAAADLVVVPAEQASQSGVLALACRLGTPTVAADVGGMAELASRTFAAGNSASLTAAIQAELDAPAPVKAPHEDGLVAECHRRAYELRS